MRTLLTLFIRSVVLTAGCVLFAIAFNAVRANGIELGAPAPYDIYVPCPETETEAEAVSAEQLDDETTLYLDARPESDFERSHIKGAVSFPYPLLGDPPADRVDELKTRGVPIVTYDGGGRDSSGELMAALLTELGVPDVTHLEGGMQTWREQGREIEGEEAARTGEETDGGADAQRSDEEADGSADSTAESEEVDQ